MQNVFMVMYGWKWGRQRKGGGLVVQGFSAYGRHIPSLCLSASSAVAGVECVARISYDVPVKVPRVGVAESVADVAILSIGVEWLQVGLR